MTVAEREAMHATARPFEVPAPITPIPLLADLRAFVLERSHNRLPKWKFRFDADLWIRIQPKPAERRDRFYLFDCRAYEDHDDSTLELSFGIVERDGCWAMKAHSAGGSHSPFPDIETAHGRERARWVEDRSRAWRALRSRVPAALRSGHLDALAPDLLLTPNCLICGRGLTDPVSMSRLIGPECFGSSSLNVNFELHSWLRSRLTEVARDRLGEFTAAALQTELPVVTR